MYIYKVNTLFLVTSHLVCESLLVTDSLESSGKKAFHLRALLIVHCGNQIYWREPTSYQQARNQGAQEGASPALEKFSPPPGKMCWTWFKTIGHSSKIWTPLRKLFTPPGVPRWLRACLLVASMPGKHRNAFLKLSTVLGWIHFFTCIYVLS